MNLLEITFLQNTNFKESLKMGKKYKTFHRQLIKELTSKLIVSSKEPMTVKHRDNTSSVKPVYVQQAWTLP